MSIAFACSQCGKRYSVKEEMAGKTAKCGCGNKVVVPLPQSAAPASAPSLLDDLPSFEKPASTSGAPAAPLPSAGSPMVKAAAPTKSTSRDRGANVRRNLRRWWKILAAVTGGWFLLTLVVCIGAISYAHANHFGQRRIEMPGQGCGTASAILLAVIWLTILVIADRHGRHAGKND